MALIGSMALLQSGCQSGPLSNCRVFGPCSFLGRATNRVLHRGQGCCGSPAVSDGVVEYGEPGGCRRPGSNHPVVLGSADRDLTLERAASGSR